MNIFTVTLDAKSEVERGFTINTGTDVLDGLSDNEIRAEATKSKVIKLQIPLRKCNDADSMQDYLRKHGYEDATVTDGIIREVSAKSQVTKEFKALSDIVGEEKAIAIMTKAIADAKAENTETV